MTLLIIENKLQSEIIDDNIGGVLESCENITP